MNGIPRDVGALEYDAARIDGDEPADQVDQGGLARSVGADEGEHLTLRHGEVHVVHGVRIAEVLGQPGRLEQAHDAGALRHF